VQDGFFSASINSVDGSHWSVALAARWNQPLVPGIYDGAIRVTSRTLTEPGLDISGNGRACSEIKGRFTIHEASFGPYGYVERFRATFVQSCGREPADLLGEIVIVNPPAQPVAEATVTVDPNSTVDLTTDTVTLSGTVTCNRRVTASRYTIVTQDSLRRHVGQPLFECSEVPTPWRVTL
jgi:hypothetical protein